MKILEIELKSCPFCGNRVKVHDNKHMRGMVTSFWVYCPGCGVESGSYGNKQEVIDAWNKRCPLPLWGQGVVKEEK